jgi:hypothetical protein
LRQRDEIAPLHLRGHSITSSARAGSSCGAGNHSSSAGQDEIVNIGESKRDVIEYDGVLGVRWKIKDEDKSQSQTT